MNTEQNSIENLSETPIIKSRESLLKRLFYKSKYLLLIAAVVLIAVLFIWITFQNQPGSPAIEAVPADALVIIDTDNTHSLLKDIGRNSDIWNSLKQIPDLKTLHQDFTYFDTLISQSKSINGFAEERHLILSAHQIGKNMVAWQTSIALKQRTEEAEIIKFIEKHFNNKAKISDRVYDNVKVYDVYRNKTNGLILSFSFPNGIFIISSSSMQIENAVRQMNLGHSVMKNDEFRRIYQMTGSNLKGKLFIQSKELATFAENYLKESIVAQAIPTLGSWIELDLNNIRISEALLSGYVTAQASSNQFAEIFINTLPQRIHSAEILPYFTGWYAAIGADNFSTFQQQYRRYLSKYGSLEFFDHELERTDKLYGFDVDTLMNQVVEFEIGKFWIPGQFATPDDNFLAYFRVRSPQYAQEILEKISRSHAKSHDEDWDKTVQNFSGGNGLKFKIYKFPIQNFTERMYGGFFKGFYSTWYTYLGDYLVFSYSEAALKKVIEAYVLNKTLSRDAEYKEFSESVASKSNFLLFVRPTAINYLSTHAKKSLAQPITDNLPVFEKLYAVAFQLSKSNNNALFASIYAKQKGKSINMPGLNWTTRLEDTPTMKPAVVVNHMTKDKEIFVQDASNKIYLIDKNGKPIWMKHLDERIVSDIYQIDFYRNKKLQLAFSTKNFLYIIDRNGIPIENFPVKFPSPATIGISLFDYEDNGNYRFFVATENKHLYGFGKDGKMIDDWRSVTTAGTVKNQIQHFLIDEKDYIVVSDEQNTYLYDRKAEKRVNVATSFPRSSNLFYIDAKNKEHDVRLVTTTPMGTVIYLYLNGKVTKLEIEDYKENHYFNLTDLNGDFIKEYVFVEENVIEAFTAGKKEIFSRKFDDDVIAQPDFYNFGKGKSRIGIALKNEIYLIDAKTGADIKGFPMEGETRFSIAKLGTKSAKFSIITGNSKNFIFNYSYND